MKPSFAKASAGGRALAVVGLLSSVLGLQAFDVYFNFGDFMSRPQAVRGFSLQPLPPYSTTNSAGAILTPDKFSKSTDLSGGIWVSNVIDGFYKSVLQGASMASTNYYYFTSTNSTLNARDCRVEAAQVPLGTQIAYSQSAADSRFALNLSGHATNLTMAGTTVFSDVANVTGYAADANNWTLGRGDNSIAFRNGTGMDFNASAPNGLTFYSPARFMGQVTFYDSLGNPQIAATGDGTTSIGNGAKKLVVPPSGVPVFDGAAITNLQGNAAALTNLRSARIAFVGDSLTDPTTCSGWSTNLFRDYAEMADMLWTNVGVSGYQTLQIDANAQTITNWLAQTRRSDLRFAWYLGGHNDIGHGSNALATFTQAAATWRSLTNAGAKLIVGTTWYAVGDPYGPEMDKFNDLVRSNFPAYGARLVDLANMIDPNQGMTYDGLHPNAIAAAQIESAVAEAVLSHVTPLANYAQGTNAAFFVGSSAPWPVNLGSGGRTNLTLNLDGSVTGFGPLTLWGKPTSTSAILAGSWLNADGWNVLSLNGVNNIDSSFYGGPGVDLYANAAPGQSVRLSVHNSAQATVNVTGLGVGTDPKSKLHVAANDTDRVVLGNSAVNFDTNSPKLSLFGYWDGTHIVGPSLQKITTSPSNGEGRLAIWQHLTGDYVNETEVVSVLANGNVGIGDTNPTVKLAVNGTVSATGYAGDGTSLVTRQATLLTGVCQATIGTAPVYLALGSLSSDSEAAVRCPLWNYTTTLTNLAIYYTAIGVSTNFTATLMTNGVAALPSVSLDGSGGGSQGNDPARSAVVPAGSSITLKIVGNNAVNATVIAGWSVEAIH